MKTKNTILAIIVLIACIMTGCGYESTQEYELLTIRLYTVTEESGIFTTKTTEYDLVEISYQRGDEIKTIRLHTNDIKVGEETKVVEEEGGVSPKIYLTQDDYNELYGLN